MKKVYLDSAGDQYVLSWYHEDGSLGDFYSYGNLDEATTRAETTAKFFRARLIIRTNTSQEVIKDYF